MNFIIIFLKLGDMMTKEIIDVSKKNLKTKPNFDYDKICKNFKWENFHDELEWFEKGKLNAAYNAVDRHAKTWRRNKVAMYYRPQRTYSPQRMLV